jgi:uncharacterized membrane protein
MDDIAVDRISPALKLRPQVQKTVANEIWCSLIFFQDDNHIFAALLTCCLSTIGCVSIALFAKLEFLQSARYTRFAALVDVIIAKVKGSEVVRFSDL